MWSSSNPHVLIYQSNNRSRPSLSPCFSLFKVSFSFSQSLVSSSSESRFPPLSKSSSFLIKATFPSSSFLSVLFPPLKVLSHPPRFQFPFSPSSPLLLLLATKKTAERHEAVPPFGVWFVPKWNILLLFYSVGCSLIMSSSCCFLIFSASSSGMSFQLFGESLDANQISSEKTLFCNSTSALCVSRHPAFGLRMRTFTCFTFVSILCYSVTFRCYGSLLLIC